jgi:membrane protein required for colicin V production
MIMGMGPMNGLDYAIIAAIGVGALYGLSRGALRMLTSVLSLVVAVYVASIKYEWVAGWVRHQFAANPTMSAVIGYAVIFVAVFAVIEIVGRMAIRAAEIAHLNWLDRLGGVLFGAAVAAALAGLAVMLMTAVMPADAPLLSRSQLARRMVAYNQTLLNYVPKEVKTAYETKTAALLHDWIKQAQKELSENAAGTASPTPSPASR